MRIGIIGASGNMGTALSRSMAKAGHELFLFARDEEMIEGLVNEISDTVESPVHRAPAIDELVKNADIVILAVPYKAERDVAGKIKDDVEGKIVISISNPLNDNYDDLVTRPGKSAGEELQEALSNASVVKAFNTVFAADYAQPNIGGKQVDAFVAGDDENAVNRVAELVQSIGLNPLLAGKLSTSRTLEQMQLLLIQLNMKNDYNGVAGWKVLHF